MMISRSDRAKRREVCKLGTSDDAQLSNARPPQGYRLVGFGYSYMGDVLAYRSQAPGESPESGFDAMLAHTRVMDERYPERTYRRILVAVYEEGGTA